MKTLLLVLSLLSVHAVYAQTASVTNANISSNRLSGNFIINIKNGNAIDHVNINYLLLPNPVSDLLSVELSTANSIYLRARVVNNTGKILASWEPENISYVYHFQLNMTGIYAGKYCLEILNKNNVLLHSVPFNKQ